MAKFCRQCGTPLHGRRFCSECGADSGPSQRDIHATPTPTPQAHAPAPSSYYAPAAEPPPSYYAPVAMPSYYAPAPVTEPSSYYAPAAASTPAAPSVPPAAVGDEATSLYKRIIATVRAAHRGEDEEGAVKAFKRDCKHYGQGRLTAEAFTTNVYGYFGEYMMESMMPQLVRLIPDDAKRADLMNAYVYLAAHRPKGGGSSSSTLSSSSLSTPPPATYTAPPVEEARSRSDKPSCHICAQTFDLMHRKRQCRKCGRDTCSSCSATRMLIPPGHEHALAKGFDPAAPQRVCTACAPMLQPLQDKLISAFANANKASEAPKSKKWFQSVPLKQSIEDECENAGKILRQFFDPTNLDRRIPVAFLERAHGLAFLTVVKAGLLITAKLGSGLVITKLPNGTWSAPAAIGTTGLGGGFEGGGEVVQILLILGTPKAVQQFHDTQITIGAGLDVTMGPYGRSATVIASMAKGNGLGANYSYSHSKGLFAGISLHGAVITCRSDANRDFYGRHIQPSEILSGVVAPPRAAGRLYDAIDAAMQSCVDYRQEQEVKLHRECSMFGCPCDRFRPQKFSTKCGNCNHPH
ncbi:hypothetical protein SPRG_10270 [Saprolegnia parasitica CBS 223.65]|uniref:FYVE-type domain-containing protein n=1 Tax=Saprolegnia parasitica (strain CBS 223.65) TaxID=695850 RepID=A0A067CDY2_SAPPC|nr:hypothetical protein SPRG_10270 [Saprolegnia parasitica CBS 223.65]KDO24736.1 hypothetical protein SPRG_10270 [Saprolegnia parasitica CBS 223.65]|eukprot:XP_012204616.1 hypothetical protein SPRG_10270 [Saprolegnia parasitica CBS 223.65]